MSLFAIHFWNSGSNMAKIAIKTKHHFPKLPSSNNSYSACWYCNPKFCWALLSLAQACFQFCHPNRIYLQTRCHVIQSGQLTEDSLDLHQSNRRGECVNLLKGMTWTKLIDGLCQILKAAIISRVVLLHNIIHSIWLKNIINFNSIKIYHHSNGTF